MLTWSEFGPDRYISQTLNNGEFDYYLVVAVDEYDDGYLGGVDVVSPSEAGPRNLALALECCGTEPDEVEGRPAVAAEFLYEYGVRAPMVSKIVGEDTDLDEFVKELKAQAEAVNGLFGFYMDRQINAIGATGWDFIRGDVVPPSLQRDFAGQSKNSVPSLKRSQKYSHRRVTE